jgi:hypothetical protein
MPDAPMPLKVVLGLAATAVEEARKLPETLPAVITQAPVLAITTAMSASLRLQQRLASLASRGDEVLSRVRGTSEEPPSWATFDDPPAEAAGSAELPRAAFDLIDYDAGTSESDDPLSDFDPPARPTAKRATPKKAARAQPPAATPPAASTPPTTRGAAKKVSTKRAPRKDSPEAVAEVMAVIAAAPAPAKKASRKNDAGGPGGNASDLAAEPAVVHEDSPEE